MSIEASESNLIPRRKLAAMRLPASIVGLAAISFMMFSILADSLITYTPATGLNFPQLTGRVVDAADVLSPTTEAQLTQISQQIENATQAQFVVATLPDLLGTTIEDYGYQLGRHWGIGRKGYDDGVMLIVAPTERAMRIEVGYGLEGILTDALTSTIVQMDIIPKFKEGQMEEGVLLGAQKIAMTLTADESREALPTLGAMHGEGGFASPQSKQSTLDTTFILIVFGLFLLFPLSGIFYWIACLINPAYGNALVPRPASFEGNSYGRRWNDGGGGGSSGGGFSGGGGSFGGGGSSGRW